MKKLVLIVSALALVLGLAQCKRPKMPNVDGSKSQTVTFTVNSSSGDKGAFDNLTTHLKYKWSPSDVICVYAIIDDENGCGFVGKLYTDDEHIIDDGYTATFSSEGEMEIPVESNKLRFVHYGSAYNPIVAAEDFDGEVSADFSVQYGTFDEVSANVIAYCDKDINESGSYGNCTLDVQYGVAKFDFDKFFSSEESGDVTLSCIVENGLTISNSGVKTNTKGIYTTLKKDSTTNINGYFVIMMPIDNSKPIKFFDNEYMSIYNLKNNVDAGKYYTKNAGGESIEIVFDNFNDNGILKGAFSAGYRDCLHFAKGNLQWSANNGGSEATTHNVNGGGTAAGTWRFAPNQYDCIRSDNEKISGSYSGWIDLFGWGTSGWNNGNKFYQPYSSGGRDEDPEKGYGYGPTDGESYNFDLTGTNSDWGVYNAIDGTFGGTVPNKWLTPTFDEMKWIVGDKQDAEPGVTCRTSSTIGDVENARFAQVVLDDDHQGLLVFPDIFVWNVTTMGQIPEYINNYDLVTPTHYTLEQFNKMEEAGVLFLPCGGYRDTRAQGMLISDCHTRGDYWLSTSNDGEAAYYFESVADGGDCHVKIRNDWGKHLGYCVRLAR